MKEIGSTSAIKNSRVNSIMTDDKGKEGGGGSTLFGLWAKGVLQNSRTRFEGPNPR